MRLEEIFNELFRYETDETADVRYCLLKVVMEV
jgi:hypothetical protein